MSVIISILNQFIKTDLGFKASLNQFEGKVLCFEIINFGSLCFQIHEEHFEPIASNETSNIHADLTIIGRPIKFLDYAHAGFPENPNHYEIEIKGDLSFGRDWMLNCKHFKIDWDRLASMLINEQAGLTLSDLAPKIKTSFIKNKTVLESSLTQFLQAELKLLPSKLQCLDLNEDIIKLRQDVDCFEAKLNLLLKAQHDH